MRQNNWKSRIKRWIAASLSLILCVVLLCPVFVSAEETDGSTIHIKTQDDLKELADNCKLDTWSQGKTVILDTDLTLDENAEEFLPVPSFGGTFDGSGHVVSGFCLEGDDSRAGLFDTLQSGYLDGCSNTGLIKGRKDVGGIAGQLEPQVTLRYDEDLLNRLGTELDKLQNLTNQAAADAQAGSSTLFGGVNSLISDIGSAKEAVNGLSSAITDWGNENIGQINDVSARLS